MGKMPKQMPLYRRTNILALKIKGIAIGETVVITPADEGFTDFEPEFGWLARYCGPDEGKGGDYGYFIIRDDGLQSWLPSDVFEKSCTRIDGQFAPVPPAPTVSDEPPTSGAIFVATQSAEGLIDALKKR